MMRSIIKSEKFGEIVYDENAWTGRKSVTIDGKPLEKVGKNAFTMPDGTAVTVKGNFLIGSKLLIGGDTVTLSPTIKWYEIVLSVLPFILIMVWGNVVSLCAIVPVVGGAIGGGISGLLSAVNLCVIKLVKPVWLKVLISIGMLGATFGICCGIGYAILGALT